jgi:anti-sigma28 factor (negative regulator of flagellin synthesis)
MGSKSKAPPPPDYGPLAASNAEAARIAQETAREDLAFRRQVHQESLPREQQLYNLASQVATQQMGIAGANEQRAAQQWQQHQQTFRPIEQQMALESYGSQFLGDQDVQGLQAAIASGDQVAINRYTQLGSQAAGTRYQGLMDAADLKARGIASTEAVGAKTAAAADINSAYAQQARGLMRMGGQPNQIAAAAAQMANQQALARVGAANNTYRSVYNQERGIARNDAANQFGMTERGVGLRAGAASFGRNMPNTAAQSYGLATQAGNSAVANQNAGFMAGLPYAQYQSGGVANQLGAAGLQQQGNLGLANLQNQAYGAQMQAHGQGMAGLGAAVGMLGSAAIFASDRRLKSNAKLVGTHPLGIGIYEYTIDGRRERGVMADEVERVRPEAVSVSSDGYKLVDYSKLR